MRYTVACEASYDKGKFKWMAIKDLKMNLTVKDKSKAK